MAQGLEVLTSETAELDGFATEARAALDQVTSRVDALERERDGLEEQAEDLLAEAPGRADASFSALLLDPDRDLFFLRGLGRCRLHPVFRAHHIGPGVEQRKAPGPVGRFHHARFEAGIAHGSRLLITGSAKDGDCSAQN